MVDDGNSVGYFYRMLQLVNGPLASYDQMMKTTPEQQKAGMEAWMTWSRKAAGAIVDLGAPLGKTLKVIRSTWVPAGHAGHGGAAANRRSRFK